MVDPSTLPTITSSYKSTNERWITAFGSTKISRFQKQTHQRIELIVRIDHTIGPVAHTANSSRGNGDSTNLGVGNNSTESSIHCHVLETFLGVLITIISKYNVVPSKWLKLNILNITRYSKYMCSAEQESVQK
jgi:hypothetical protein